MSMNLKELAVEVHQISIDHGWWEKYNHHKLQNYVAGYRPLDPCPDILAAKLALIHAEISESFDEWDAGRYKAYYNSEEPSKPEGLVVELADVLIRTLDFMHHLGFVVRPPSETVTMCRWPYLKALGKMHALVSLAVECLRRNDMYGTEENLDGLVCFLCEVAAGYLADRTEFEDAIRKKVDYNKTREIRHGGKAL